MGNAGDSMWCVAYTRLWRSITRSCPAAGREISLVSCTVGHMIAGTCACQCQRIGLLALSGDALVLTTDVPYDGALGSMPAGHGCIV